MSRYFHNVVSKLGSMQHADMVNVVSGCKKMDGAVVMNVVRDATKVRGNVPIYTLDRAYQCPSESKIKSALKWDGTDRIKYTAEATDCDNFAIILCGRMHELAFKCDLKGGGLAFGVVTGQFVKDGKLSEKHMMNFMVTRKKKFVLVEPQTDKMYAHHDQNVYEFFMI